MKLGVLFPVCLLGFRLLLCFFSMLFWFWCSFLVCKSNGVRNRKKRTDETQHEFQNIEIFVTALFAVCIAGSNWKYLFFFALCRYASVSVSVLLLALCVWCMPMFMWVCVCASQYTERMCTSIHKHVRVYMWVCVLLSTVLEVQTLMRTHVNNRPFQYMFAWCLAA